MKTQHTPGPWITQTDEIGKVRITDSATEGITIAEVRTRFVAIGRLKACASVEEREANAQLIAAAPELLAALGEMLEQFGHYCEGTEDPAEIAAQEQARAALNKAKGNT